MALAPHATVFPRSAAGAPGSHRREALQHSTAIVAALDVSGSAACVLAAATRLVARTPGATLHVIHVFRQARLDHARVGVPAMPPEAVGAAAAYLENRVIEARARCDVDVVGHFAVGDPVEEIVRVSSELCADVVVVGDHVRHGLARLLLGSLTETLTRRVRCSVLVVRPSGHMKRKVRDS